MNEFLIAAWLAIAVFLLATTTTLSPAIANSGSHTDDHSAVTEGLSEGAIADLEALHDAFMEAWTKHWQSMADDEAGKTCEGDHHDD